ncbi:DUF3526 domain-containing protein [Teredinibacter turnerae]|uniref:DUF3526 domain-containing protein n=1 Tax=Teredinibacter turnerae TaxID=2426 RepID=UPI00035F5059|nr:DUF3526 domain-containing protein [Teredinibacter turnerae]
MNNLKMEFRLLFRNRSVILLCSAYLMVGLLALVFGVQRFYSQQNQAIELEAQYQQDVAEWKQKVDSKGVGYAAYYLFNPVVFQPSPWSALFSGERKENLVLQRVRLLAVHGQIHGSPINNSEHSLLGVLDVQFLWLYLLPLLIGLITVTCIADDRRLGRWPLINAMSSVRALLTKRVAVRFALISLINILILLLACLLLPITFGRDVFSIVLTLVSYQVFWFLISGLIILAFLNARQSVLTFVAIWVVSAWLIPSLHYSSSLDAETYNTGVELLVNQRQEMNDSWDRDKQADFQQFLSQHPEWKNTPALGDSFEWKWYFAMQKRSDDQVSKLADLYFQSKGHDSNRLKWLSPTLMTQTLFEDVANTSAADNQHWLQSVVDWHSKTQSFWFPYFFFDKSFDKEDLSAIPQFEFDQYDAHTTNLAVYWAVIIILCLIFLFFLDRQNLQGRSTRVSV